MPTIGLIGGTGAQGRGLALRWALAGHTVLLGSRDAARAAAAVAKVAAKAEASLDVRAATNAAVAELAEVVGITLPYAGQRVTLEPLAESLAGKLVIECVNALAFDERGPYPLRVEAGSAAEEAQAVLPSSRVVAAFQSVSASALLRVSEPVEGDVLLVSDDEAARKEVAELVAAIADLRPIDVGPLRLAAPIEDLTAVLLAINQRHHTHAGIRLTGL